MTELICTFDRLTGKTKADSATYSVLLRELFGRTTIPFTRLQASEFPGGRLGKSRAHVFLVHAYARGGAVLNWIVKIDTVYNVEQEAHNYRAFVQDRLAPLQGRLLGPARHGRWGALAYAHLGGQWARGIMRTLAEVYADPQVSTPELLDVLRTLLVDVLAHGPRGQNGWYNTARCVRQPLRRSYSRMLPVDFVLALRQQPKVCAPASPPGRVPARTPGAQGDEDLLQLIQCARERRLSPSMLDEHYGSTSGQFRIAEIERPNSELPGRIRVIRSGNVQGDLAPEIALDLQVPQALWPQETPHIGNGLSFWGIPVPGSQRQARLAHAIGQLSIVQHMLDRGYPHPLPPLESTLDRCVEQRVCIIHGDLHPFNVLVDGNGQPWPIDFSFTRDEAPLVYDFAKLETEIRTQILSGQLGDVAQAIALEEALLAEMQDEPVDRAALTAAQKRALDVISQIRHIALTAWRPQARPSPAEYYRALYLCGTGTLKYGNLYRPTPRAAEWAFISAAAACRALQEGILPRTPPDRFASLHNLADHNAIKLEQVARFDVSKFVGRETERERGYALIEQGRSLVIAGPPGAGKTALGQWLAREWGDERCYWCTLRNGAKSTIESILRELSTRLAEIGRPRLRAHAFAPHPDWKAAGDVLLKELAGTGLRCFFDDCRLQDGGDPEVEALLNTLLEHSPSGIVLLSRHPHAAYTGSIFYLAPLSFTETGTLLSRHGLELPFTFLRRAQAHTAGYPHLLVALADAYHRLSAPRTHSQIGTLLAHFSEEHVMTDALSQLWAWLPREQRTVAERLCVFDGPVARPVLERLLTRQQLADLEHPFARAYLDLDAHRRVMVWPCFRQWVYDRLSPSAAKALHLDAAHACTHAGDSVQAFVQQALADKKIAPG